MGVLDLVKIIWFPEKVYRRVKEEPDFWIPLIFILVVLTISTIITIKFMNFSAPEYLKLTPEQIQQIQEFRNSTRGIILSLIPALFVTTLLLIIVSGVVKVGLLIISAKIDFKRLFTIVSFSYLAFSFRQIIMDVYVIITHSSTIYFNPLAFVNISPLSITGFWLSKIEIFNIWWIFLLATGIKVVGDVSFKKSLVFTFILWLSGNIISFIWFYFSVLKAV